MLGAWNFLEDPKKYRELDREKRVTFEYSMQQTDNLELGDCCNCSTICSWYFSTIIRASENTEYSEGG